MTSIYDRLEGAASQAPSLLQTLAKTQFSVSSYQQNNHFITLLKKEIAEQEKKRNEVAHVKLDKKSDGDENYLLPTGTNSSSSKKALLEERTLAQKATKKILERLNSELSQATSSGEELLKTLLLHHKTNLAFDSLFNNIFSGPSPSMPTLEGQEDLVVDAQRDFDIVQGMYRNEVQTLKMLISAQELTGFAKRGIDRTGDPADCDEADGNGKTFIEIQEFMGVPLGSSSSTTTDPDVDHQFLITHIPAIQKKIALEISNTTIRMRKLQTELSTAKDLLHQRRIDLQEMRNEAFTNLADMTGGVEPAEGLPELWTGEEVGMGWVLVNV